MRISDWSSDVCSSDLADAGGRQSLEPAYRGAAVRRGARRSCREDDQPGARRWHLGDLRSLHRFVARLSELGSAQVCTPDTNAHLVCRLLLEKKTYSPDRETKQRQHILEYTNHQKLHEKRK